jgi:hypothetical protein
MRMVEPDDTWWHGMLGALRGRFAETAEALEGDREDVNYIVCAFLSGRVGDEALASTQVWPGIPSTVADCWLAAGRLTDAEVAVAALLGYVEEHSKQQWTDERVRCDLLQAELSRRRGDLGQCHGALQRAAGWIRRSASQEHLCRLHLGRGRLAIDESQLDEAATILDEGLHVAEHCGFGALHLELLVARAELALHQRQPENALLFSRTALNGMAAETRMPPETADFDPGGLLLVGARHPACGHRFIASDAEECEHEALKSVAQSAHR